MATVLLASGNTEATSPTFDLSDGASARVFLSPASGVVLPSTATALIQSQTAAGGWVNEGLLSYKQGSWIVNGAGTFRVVRPAQAIAIAVDRG